MVAIRILLHFGPLNRLVFPGALVLERHRIRNDAEEIFGLRSAVEAGQDQGVPKELAVAGKKVDVHVQPRFLDKEIKRHRGGPGVPLPEGVDVPELGNEIAHLLYFLRRIKDVPIDCRELFLEVSKGGIDIRCEDIVDGPASQQRLGFIDVDGPWLSRPII